MTAYATVAEADAYFVTRLYADVWVNSTSQNKQKALATAARIIDRLNFQGEKHSVYETRLSLLGTADTAVCLTDDQYAALMVADAEQELQFPRGSDTEPPNDVKIASYEIAYALLDGVDPDIEFQDQGVVSQGYSSVRTTYDRSIVQEHINAGIPSPTAWRYLKPYVSRNGGVKLRRV